MIKKYSKVKIVVVILSIGIIAMLWFFTYKEREKEILEEAERIKEARTKKYFMYIINPQYCSLYKSPEYDEKYWKQFLADKNTSRRLDYVNQYMEDKYPDSPYTKVTVDDLEKNYEQISCLWDDEVDNYVMQNNGCGAEIPFSDIVLKVGFEGLRRDIVSLLGYTELAENYDYNTTYVDVFLHEKDLVMFLDRLNQYMEANYPRSVYKELTLERLENESQDICDELWEVTEELGEQGINFADIVEDIHQQIAETPAE